MKKCCNRLRLRTGVGVDKNLPTPTPTPQPCFQQRQLPPDGVEILLFFVIVLFLLCYKFVLLFILESVESEHIMFPKNH